MALRRRAVLGRSSPCNIIKGQLGVTAAFLMGPKPERFHGFMQRHHPEYPSLDPNTLGIPHEYPLNTLRQRAEYPRSEVARELNMSTFATRKILALRDSHVR